MSSEDRQNAPGGAAARRGLGARKDEHLELCLHEDVEHARPTLLDDVHLLHDALPERALGAVSLETELLGRRLRAPLLVSGMTGGTARAAEVNRDLARACQSRGIAFGLGSQRAMHAAPERAQTYAVRDVAPDVLLFGNIGAQQLEAIGVEGVRALLDRVGADAIFVHLNPAQELAQPEGDRDFSGCLEGIRRLVDALGPRVWVKETGCGISRRAAERLVAAGVGGIDVSGAGGTSWTRVESLRAAGREESVLAVGRELASWGIPTAACVAACADLGVPLVASGGIRSALDVARALALGATLGGFALPALRAQASGGTAAVEALLDGTVATLRAVTLLTGAASAGGLAQVPRVLTGELPRWIERLRADAGVPR